MKCSTMNQKGCYCSSHLADGIQCHCKTCPCAGTYCIEGVCKCSCLSIVRPEPKTFWSKVKRWFDPEPTVLANGRVRRIRYIQRYCYD